MGNRCCSSAGDEMDFQPFLQIPVWEHVVHVDEDAVRVERERFRSFNDQSVSRKEYLQIVEITFWQCLFILSQNTFQYNTLMEAIKIYDCEQISTIFKYNCDQVNLVKDDLKNNFLKVSKSDTSSFALKYQDLLGLLKKLYKRKPLCTEFTEPTHMSDLENNAVETNDATESEKQEVSISEDNEEDDIEQYRKLMESFNRELGESMKKSEEEEELNKKRLEEEAEKRRKEMMELQKSSEEAIAKKQEDQKEEFRRKKEELEERHAKVMEELRRQLEEVRKETESEKQEVSICPLIDEVVESEENEEEIRRNSNDKMIEKVKQEVGAEIDSLPSADAPPVSTSHSQNNIDWAARRAEQAQDYQRRLNSINEHYDAKVRRLREERERVEEEGRLTRARVNRSSQNVGGVSETS